MPVAIKVYPGIQSLAPSLSCRTARRSARINSISCCAGAEYNFIRSYRVSVVTRCISRPSVPNQRSAQLALVNFAQQFLRLIDGWVHIGVAVHRPEHFGEVRGVGFIKALDPKGCLRQNKVPFPQVAVGDDNANGNICLSISPRCTRLFESVR